MMTMMTYMGFYLHLMMGMNFCKIFGFFYEIVLFSCNEKNCQSSLKVKLLVYRDLTISWFVIFFIFRMRFDLSYFYIFSDCFYILLILMNRWKLRSTLIALQCVINCEVQMLILLLNFEFCLFKPYSLLF